MSYEAKVLFIASMAIILYVNIYEEWAAHFVAGVCIVSIIYNLYELFKENKK